MFEIGEFIICGNNGVCEVKEIGDFNSSGTSKDKLYYTLEPNSSKGSKIYIPIDNVKVKMRSIINKKDAMSLINEIEDIETLWIQDEKHRELNYKEAIKKYDCRELVKIMKTIYLRKQNCLAVGKKVSMTDEKYLKMAEENLYNELEISFDMSKDEIKKLMGNKL